jgi:hypothetical protein
MGSKLIVTKFMSHYLVCDSFAFTKLFEYWKILGEWYHLIALYAFDFEAQGGGDAVTYPSPGPEIVFGGFPPNESKFLLTGQKEMCI